MLDILLYDFAEKYELGFTREDEMNDREFYAVAKVLEKSEAIEFTKWWRKEQQKLSNEVLWRKRNVSFHRGSVGIEHNYFGYGTGTTSGTITFVSVQPVFANHVSSRMGVLSHLMPHSHRLHKNFGASQTTRMRI